MTSNFLNELEEDSKDIPADDKLKKINTLYERFASLSKSIAILEERLSLEKKELNKITDFEIPLAMSEAGCQKFVTDSGFQLEVKPFYTAKIDDDNRDDCFSWLRDNDFDDLIKHQISIKLNKGEDSIAEKIIEELRKLGTSFIDEESIHHRTLTAFVKERIEKGEDFPLSLFRVYIGQTTKVKMV
jgi:hypothetical protein